MLSDGGKVRIRRNPRLRSKSYRAGGLLQEAAVSPLEADNPAQLATDGVVEDVGDELGPSRFADDFDRYSSGAQDFSPPGSTLPGERLLQGHLRGLALSGDDAKWEGVGPRISGPTTRRSRAHDSPSGIAKASQRPSWHW